MKINWKDKRLKELQDMIDNGCHPELLIDEYNDVVSTNADSWEQFLEEQEERKLKYQPQFIRSWK